MGRWVGYLGQLLKDGDERVAGGELRLDVLDGNGRSNDVGRQRRLQLQPNAPAALSATGAGGHAHRGRGRT